MRLAERVLRNQLRWYRRFFSLSFEFSRDRFFLTRPAADLSREEQMKRKIHRQKGRDENDRKRNGGEPQGCRDG